MSQGNYVIDNLAGAGFRAAVNEALAAIVTNNSGATEPATMYAYQWWADTSANMLKRRNAGNTAWVSVMSLSLAISSFAEDLLAAVDAAAAMGVLGALPVDGSVRMTGDLAFVAGKGMVLEGATEDAFEVTLTAVEPTADRVLQLPDKSGVLATTSDVPLIPNHITGLKISPTGSSTSMPISAGIAADGANTTMMVLASAITKTTAAWALGTAAGSLDTGVIANNTTYHFFLMRRPDTGVVDVCSSLSPTAPTTGGAIPAAFTQFRRFASRKTNGSAQWVGCIQDGDFFQELVGTLDVNATNPGTSAVTRTLSVPTGINVIAVMNTEMTIGSVGATVYFSDLAVTDEAPSNIASPLGQLVNNNVGLPTVAQINIRTNTSAQIRSRVSASDASLVLRIATLGYYDTRGRNA